MPDVLARVFAAVTTHVAEWRRGWNGWRDWRAGVGDERDRNISSGFLLRAGVPVWANIAAAFVGFAVSAFIVYAGTPAPAAIVVAAALALGLGGLAPGALYAAAPQAAPSPQAVPPTTGLVQQASNLGQFTGPLVLGLWVQHFGCPTAPPIVAPAALFGLAVAFMVRRAMDCGAGIEQGRREGKKQGIERCRSEQGVYAEVACYHGCPFLEDNVAVASLA